MNTDRSSSHDTPEVVVSVVMPCLNEEATIGECIAKALRALDKHSICGEVVIADNGSTDRSIEIAASFDQRVRVVHQSQRGYGAAYLKGFAEAQGRYIVMGDSDNTYDFGELERFLGPLRNGYDLVMGNRFKGQILPGAMPWLHRYVGNPVLSGILNLFFHTGIGDAHCGIRAFRGEALEKMRLQTPGMEFASEMVINAAKAGLRMTEVPITYYPRQGQSKLRSFRDGWRHLRFMLLYSPTWLFAIPGLTLFAVGMLVLLLLLPGPLTVGGHAYDVHAMVVGSLLAILGFQVVNLGVYARTYAVNQHFDENDPVLVPLWRYFTLERGIYVGLTLLAVGSISLLWVLKRWVEVSFGPMDEMRLALIGMTFFVLGVQTVFSSFFLSLLGLKEPRRGETGGEGR